MRRISPALSVILLLAVRAGCCGAPRPAAFFMQPPDMASFDQYGGSKLLSCGGGATGKFYTEKIGDRWWLCTPAGNVFWAMGVYEVMPNNSTDLAGVNTYQLVGQKYLPGGPTNNGLTNWCLQAVRRLKSWGFNTLDMYAYARILPWTNQGSSFPKDPGSNKSTLPLKMPAMTSGIKPSHYALYNAFNYADQPVKNLITGIKTSVYTGWRSSPVADYFDPRFQTWMEADFRNTNHTPDTQADWLLGVVVDDTDYLWWAGGGTDFATVPAGKNSIHAGWVTLVTAPVQAAGSYNGANQIFADARVYAKERLAAFLEEKYETISGLNAAWNSSYSAFGSTGTAVTGEEIGIGDGLTATFTGTLSQAPPGAFSIQVLVNGKAIGGDDGAGRFRMSNGQTMGTVDYASGAIAIVLDAPAEENAVVAVNYSSCGFGCGTGVLDEDGSHAWIPRLVPGNSLIGGDPVRADLDAFLHEYASHYFAMVKEQVNQYYPGYLYFGPTSLGSWGSPPRKEILQAATQYLDVLRLGPVGMVKAGPGWDERMNYIAQWGGDKPWTTWVGARANPDSYFANDPRGAAGGCADTAFTTQQERGQWYQNLMQSLVARTADGTRHFVGINFWQLFDNRKECANWGLISWRDNPYDGLSATMAAGTDEWGYPTGGEAADYGDFLGAVKSVNWLWTPRQDAQAGGFQGAGLRGTRTR